MGYTLLSIEYIDPIYLQYYIIQANTCFPLYKYTLITGCK